MAKVNTDTVSEFDALIDVSEDADLSNVVLMGDFTPVKLVTPSALTSASISFEVSHDYDRATETGTFVPLTDNNTDIAITVATGTAKSYVLDPTVFAGVEALKIKTSGAEGADRSFTVVGARLGNR